METRQTQLFPALMVFLPWIAFTLEYLCWGWPLMGNCILINLALGVFTLLYMPFAEHVSKLIYAFNAFVLAVCPTLFLFIYIFTYGG